MLDQNTDRMWYVIGAVIIGAAIILILNNTFPQLFASVGDTFKEKTEQTTEVVDGIMPNTKFQHIYNKDVQVSTHPALAELVAYDADSATWELAIHQPLAPYNTTTWSAGLSIRRGSVVVPYGSTVTIQYDVWSPIDTVATNDVNNVPIAGKSWGSNASDNDNMAYRKMSKSNVIKANEWTTIVMTSQNTSPLNVNKTALYEYSTFGAYNPTDKPMTIKIRNVSATVTGPE